MTLRILIPDDIYQKIMFWVKSTKLEVSGMGKVVVEGNTLKVVSAFLLKQTNFAAETNLDAEAIAKAQYMLRNEPGELRWWWHSHGPMRAFWSTTDDKAIEMLSEHGWFCATVFNHDEEMKSAFRQVSPATVYLNDIPTTIERFLPEEDMKAWQAEYDANVSVGVERTYLIGPDTRDGALKPEHEWQGRPGPWRHPGPGEGSVSEYIGKGEVSEEELAALWDDLRDLDDSDERKVVDIGGVKVGAKEYARITGQAVDEASIEAESRTEAAELMDEYYSKRRAETQKQMFIAFRKGEIG